MPLSPSDRLSLRQDYVRVLEERHRRRLRDDLREWCIEALEPLGQRPAPHHELLIRKLEAVAAGEIDRLMVFMPPGSAKSTYASILFPSWFMARGKADVIAASHGADLAEDFSGKVLRTVAEHSRDLGYGLENQSVKLWRTTNGSVYRAAGAGGSITGRRADLFLIDDPIKGREDANSLTIRDKVWDWYRAEVITRLKPRARIVVIQTRWHPDDLSGRLLQEMENGGDQWDVVSLPALAESNNDPMGRAPGEALWPAWEDVAALERKRAAVGEMEWAALYQQRPRPLEGSLFKVGMVQTLDTAPAGGHIARAWDLAATAQAGGRDPDWTVGVKLARMPDGRFIVLDVVRLRGGPDEVESTIINTAKQDGLGVRVGLPQDPGQAGKQQVLYLTRKLSGYRVDSSPETGDKATRAAPMASQSNAGNLSIVRAAWNRAFLDELAGFPNATKDDQVDALSRAFSMVGLARPPMHISQEARARVGAR